MKRYDDACLENAMSARMLSRSKPWSMRIRSVTTRKQLAVEREGNLRLKRLHLWKVSSTSRQNHCVETIVHLARVLDEYAKSDYGSNTIRIEICYVSTS